MRLELLDSESFPYRSPPHNDIMYTSHHETTPVAEVLSPNLIFLAAFSIIQGGSNMTGLICV